VKVGPAQTNIGTIFTGTLFAPVLKKMIDKFNARFGTDLIVEPLENSYFGGDVSVAGLLTGQDLLQRAERVAASLFAYRSRC
jgi:NifB/MoaA-like Fe-S oxidoreductase